MKRGRRGGGLYVDVDVAVAVYVPGTYLYHIHMPRVCYVEGHRTQHAANTGIQELRTANRVSVSRFNILQAISPQLIQMQNLKCHWHAPFAPFLPSISLSRQRPGLGGATAVAMAMAVTLCRAIASDTHG